ncbi:hypothetical protein GA0115254_12003 [Streptomyces sp. Ncost-T10-10d]|nr:hypothetical protein GA0115254_12003 [Streptomyces sp. Ncost-T10-10d]
MCLLHATPSAIRGRLRVWVSAVPAAAGERYTQPRSPSSVARRHRAPRLRPPNPWQSSHRRSRSPLCPRQVRDRVHRTRRRCRPGQRAVPGSRVLPPAPCPTGPARRSRVLGHGSTAGDSCQDQPCSAICSSVHSISARAASSVRVTSRPPPSANHRSSASAVTLSASQATYNSRCRPPPSVVLWHHDAGDQLRSGTPRSWSEDRVPERAAPPRRTARGAEVATLCSSRATT